MAVTSVRVFHFLQLNKWCTLSLCRNRNIFEYTTRQFHLSLVQNRKGLKQKDVDRKMFTKQERYLQKFVEEAPKKKKKWINLSVINSPQDPSNGVKSNGGNSRRSKHLGVVFQNYISSIIQSGEAGEELVDYEVDISKVVIPNDLSSVNVYWLASGSDCDKIIESHLEEAAYKIRTILTGLRVIGRVPKIQFVRDVSEAKCREVEQLVAIADMGPDYKPVRTYHDRRNLEGDCQNNQNFSLQDAFNSQKIKFIEQDIQDGVYSSVRNFSFPEKSDTSDLAFNYNSSNEDSDSDSQEDEKRQQHKTSAVAECDTFLSMLNLQSDVYNLDHSGLMQKLLNKRRKMKKRSSILPSGGVSEPDLTHKHGKYIPGKSNQTDAQTIYRVMQNIKRQRKQRRAQGHILSEYINVDNEDHDIQFEENNWSEDIEDDVEEYEDDEFDSERHKYIDSDT